MYMGFQSTHSSLMNPSYAKPAWPQTKKYIDHKNCPKMFQGLLKANFITQTHERVKQHNKIIQKALFL